MKTKFEKDNWYASWRHSDVTRRRAATAALQPRSALVS